ncbi:hypothetical protein CR513_20184, partial [Mucuna pruriens]
MPSEEHPQVRRGATTAMPVMRNQAVLVLRLLQVIANRSEEPAHLTDEARKRREEAKKHHEKEIKQVEEREARLREQRELLRSTEGHSDPLPLPVAWGQPFNEQIDGTPIPPQFKELVVDPFDGSQDPRVNLHAFQTPVYINNDDDLISCKLFMGTLREVAMRWFSSLPPRSIITSINHKTIIQISDRGTWSRVSRSNGQIKTRINYIKVK